MKKKLKILFIILACIGIFFAAIKIHHTLTYDHEKEMEKKMHMYISE